MQKKKKKKRSQSKQKTKKSAKTINQGIIKTKNKN